MPVQVTSRRNLVSSPVELPGLAVFNRRSPSACPAAAILLEELAVTTTLANPK